MLHFSQGEERQQGDQEAQLLPHGLGHTAEKEDKVCEALDVLLARVARCL